MGPELAIYRSVTGCDERRGRRGEQAAPFASAAFRYYPLPAAISVALGPRSVGYRRTFAAARGAVLHAFAAPKFVELAPSPRNAETVGSASRDAKTVTMAHELARSFALWCPGSSATGVHLLATSRRDFVLTKAVDGVGAPTEAAGPRALSAKQRTARLGAKTHSRGPRCLRCRLGQPNDAHFKRQKLLKTLKNRVTRNLYVAVRGPGPGGILPCLSPQKIF